MIDTITAPIDNLISDAIKKCETHCFCARSSAADLRNHGFAGIEINRLIENLEKALKYAHLYQAYINVANSDE